MLRRQIQARDADVIDEVDRLLMKQAAASTRLYCRAHSLEVMQKC